MKEKLNQLLKDVDNSYNMALIKIPKALRQMPWLELCSKFTLIVISSRLFIEIFKFCHRGLFWCVNELKTFLWHNSYVFFSPSVESEKPKSPVVSDMKVSFYLIWWFCVSSCVSLQNLFGFNSLTMFCITHSQREEDAAIVDSIMSEDHAVLLKSVKKSKFKLVFVFL